MASPIAAWLMTYLLHGTLLLGFAWLVSKPLSRWSVAAEETVWKLALVGALLTATLQLGAGWEPLAGRWGLADLGTPAAQAEETAVSLPSLFPSVAVPGRPMAAAQGPSEIAEKPAPSFHLPLSSLALGAWAFGALLLLTGYLRSFAALGRRLRRRPRVVAGTLHSQLRTLAAEAGFEDGVRLTCSSRLPVPVALGLRRPEICVPPRALAGLTDEQQEGMLAHELAHLVRRDPLWLVIGNVLACVFFFQPLNWVARRRLREISEMQSDEWAVTRTGRPLSLAGCLAEVAGWSTPRRPRRPLPVPGMADRPSHLARRIRRLLDGRSPENPARRIWLGAAMVVLLVAVAAAAPAVSTARDEAGAKAQPAVKTLQVRPTVSVSVEPAENGVAEDSLDIDTDVDVDVDPGIDAIVQDSLASLDAALESMDTQLEGMTRDHALSEEEQERLEAEIERTNEHIEKAIRPRLEQLSRDLTEKLTREMPTAEMRKLQEEMETLAGQMRPSPEELARLHALVDDEVRKHQVEGEISREESRRIAREAREMAQRMRPTEEQRKALEDLRRRHQELARQFRAEHHGEIDQATREMREEIQREMEAARQELRRSVDRRRQIEREERRERQEERQKEQQKKREREDRGTEKPPRAS